MVAKFLALLKNNKALIASISALLCLYQLHSVVYDNGRESMRVELTAAHNKALEDARTEYEKSIKQSIERIQADHGDELERIKAEREVVERVETVIKYVDKEIIVTPECDGLSSDIVRVFSQATSIISDSTKDR